MRLLRSIPQTHVYFAMHNTSIVCAAIETPVAEKPLILRAYEEIHFASDIPILQSVAAKIQQFLKRHALTHSAAHIALMPSTLYENCFIFNTASPTFADFGKPEFKKYAWHTTYLHPLEDGKHRFYFCALSPATLFYYQLLMVYLQLDVARITSSYISQLNAYRRIYRSAFRQCQLAADMALTNYDLEKLFTQDTLARLIDIPAQSGVPMEKVHGSLIALIGLCHLKEGTHGY